MALIQSNGTGGGSWNTGASWAGGVAPGASDTWEILADTITIDEALLANPLGGTIRNGGRLTVAAQMGASYINGNVIVDAGGKVYASRTVSNHFRVAGTVTGNGAATIDYGTAADPISNVAVGAAFEAVCTSDNQSGRGIVQGTNDALTSYGAVRVAQTTLAQAAALGANTIVLADDMALRPGVLADVTLGTVDMIVVGQPPTIGTGAGAQNYCIDAYLVGGYDPATKTVTLADAGAGQSYWPRGGVTPTWNTIDTLARPIGTPVWLLSCNVVFRGTANNLRPANLLSGAFSATLTNCSIWWGYNGVGTGTSLTMTGLVTFSGNNSGCTSGAHTMSGTLIFSGNSNGCNYGTHTMSGTLIFSGNGYGCDYGTHTMSGTLIFSGNNTGCSFGTHTMSGTLIFSGNLSGCSFGTHTMSGALTFSGNGYGCLYGTYTMSGTLAFSGNGNGCTYGTYTLAGLVSFSGNSRDLNRVVNCTAYGVSFDSATEFLGYNTADMPQWAYTYSQDHDGVAGAFRSWCRGGVVNSVASPVYGTRPRSYQHVPESATIPVFMQRMHIIRPGETLRVVCYARKDVSMTVLPRVRIVNPAADPLVNPAYSPLAEAVMTDSVDTWEILRVSYKNVSTVEMPVLVRTLAQNASGNVYFDPIVYLGPALPVVEGSR